MSGTLQGGWAGKALVDVVTLAQLAELEGGAVGRSLKRQDRKSRTTLEGGCTDVAESGDAG